MQSPPNIPNKETNSNSIYYLKVENFALTKNRVVKEKKRKLFHLDLMNYSVMLERKEMIWI